MNFPQLDRLDLQYERKDALPIPGLSLEKSVFKAIDKKDYLLQYFQFADQFSFFDVEC